MQQKEKLWAKHFILALIITIGVNLTCNLLLSTISIYAKKITQVDSYAGLMTGVFTLSSLIIRLFAGKLLDKLGRKKILLLGIFITAFATISYAFTDQIFWILVFRALQGIGFGISSTAIATIVTDVTPESRLLEGIGYTGVGLTITTAIGPSIALKIVGNDYEDFHLLFITTFIVSIITLVISFALSYENKTNTTIYKKQKDDKITISSWGRKIIIPGLILFLAAVAESTILSFTALYGIYLGFGSIGLFFTINALGILVSRLFINQIVNRLGMNTVLFIGLPVFSMMILGISMVKTTSMLITFGFFCGIMMGTLLPIINVMIINTVSKDMRGMANAIFYALLDGGYGIGSIMWGSVVISYGYRYIYFGASIVLAIASLIFSIKLIYSKIKTNKSKIKFNNNCTSSNKLG
ncbi:MFS transporter [Clostridium uliginosum]|uniref:Predicted arabinose efflux permease, MFS family n=1 Tax=Clostridium uliginosum TaxID=119641 RepID=A0A1I1LXJ5_9CLOT|nr:MFS transporter [Clostridium uliginosum]SFC77839.1 Predicted arabinose efflux permease, MFS family [Clostridium uliginosum]